MDVDLQDHLVAVDHGRAREPPLERRIVERAGAQRAEVVLVATGDVVLAFKDGTAFDAVSGQEWVFEIAQLQREVDAYLARRDAEATLRAPAAAAGACDRTA